MTLIRFNDAETEKQALGYLAGRFNFTTWKSGETLVPEASLPHLAAKGFRFMVEGHKSYSEVYAPVRDTAAVAV